MNGKYLLDTNIVIALFDQDEVIQRKLTAVEKVFIASVVFGELYYGAYKSGRTQANHKRIDEFAFSNAILSCDLETAKKYGEIKEGLRRKGKPIPSNDIWIAAIALQHDLTLVTRDAHFQQIENLLTEAW